MTRGDRFAIPALYMILRRDRGDEVDSFTLNQVASDLVHRFDESSKERLETLQSTPSMIQSKGGGEVTFVTPAK